MLYRGRLATLKPKKERPHLEAHVAAGAKDAAFKVWTGQALRAVLRGVKRVALGVLVAA